MKDYYTTLEHIDLSEETYHTLKEKILQRQLKPGSKISVNEVANGLGVSRTPVVVALQRLAGEGLVDIHPRRGTFVKGITADEVEGVFEVRRMVELYAAQYILEKGLVQQFRNCIGPAQDQMDRATSGEDYLDYQAFMEGDQDFHFRLVDQTGNRHLIEIYRSLNAHMHVVRAHSVDDVENARQTQREHLAFLQALESNDLDNIQVAVDTHINNVKLRIIQLIQEEGGQI